MLTKNIALTLAALSLASCTTDSGRELRDPVSPLIITTTTSADDQPQLRTAIIADESAGAGGMSISSPDFAPGGPLPAETGLLTGNVSPTLAWSNIPAETTELAVVMTSVDDGSAVRWILAGISPTSTGLGEGEQPPGSVTYFTDLGDIGWFGPDPDPGEVDRYQFALYAFDRTLVIDGSSDGEMAIETIERQAISKATVVGTYAGPDA